LGRGSYDHTAHKYSYCVKFLYISTKNETKIDIDLRLLPYFFLVIFEPPELLRIQKPWFSSRTRDCCRPGTFKFLMSFWKSPSKCFFGLEVHLDLLSAISGVNLAAVFFWFDLPFLLGVVSGSLLRLDLVTQNISSIIVGERNSRRRNGIT